MIAFFAGFENMIVALLLFTFFTTSDYVYLTFNELNYQTEQYITLIFDDYLPLIFNLMHISQWQRHYILLFFFC